MHYTGHNSGPTRSSLKTIQLDPNRSNCLQPNQNRFTQNPRRPDLVGGLFQRPDLECSQNKEQNYPKTAFLIRTDLI